MAKNVFLYVRGGDYSAMTFEQEYDAQVVYEQMVAEGVKTKVIDDEDYIEISILEFGEIDEKFLSFLYSYMFDYDALKASDLFSVKGVDVDEN